MILLLFTTLDGMQYIPFQLLISVIITSCDIESCITFLLSIDNYVGYNFYEYFCGAIMEFKVLYGFIQYIVCAVGAYINP